MVPLNALSAESLKLEAYVFWNKGNIASASPSHLKGGCGNVVSIWLVPGVHSQEEFQWVTDKHVCMICGSIYDADADTDADADLCFPCM